MKLFDEARENLKSDLTTQVLAGVFAAFIIYLIGAVVGLLPSVIPVLNLLFGHLRSSVSLQWWFVWLLLGSAVYGAAIVLRGILARREIRAYTEDVFFGIKVKWEWSFWRLRPKNIQVLCPRCSTSLVYDSELSFQGSPLIVPVQKYYLECEHCDQRVAEGDVNYNKSRAFRQIMRNVETGEWRSRIVPK